MGRGTERVVDREIDTRVIGKWRGNSEEGGGKLCGKGDWKTVDT